MRHQALIQDSVSVLDLWKMLPQWINRHHPFDGKRRYVAKDIDASFNDLPTLTVEMSGARGLIATYKCNIVQVYEPHTSWLVLSPLVVIWHQDRETRGPEMGRIMIDHALGAISDFHQIHGSVGHRIVVASGN